MPVLQGEHEEQASQSNAMKRRGLIAGAAALVAGIVAAKTSQNVAAQGEPLVVGNTGTGTGVQFASFKTEIAASPALTTAPAFQILNGFSGTADAKGDGIQGFTVGANTAGSFGRNNDLNGVGIWGEAPNGTGAFGDSGAGSGVAGSSTSGAGVYGQSTSGTGVIGISTSGTGVNGATNTVGGYGGYFSHSASGGTAVAGQLAAGITGGAAFVGAAGAGNYAAYFTGDVVVTGNFVVAKINGVNTNGGKSAAVEHPLTGDHRLLYCVEAPEAWFEDFGEGTLVGGKATVKLDPNFTALIHSDSYHVFVTPHDDTHMHVSQKQAGAFTVEGDTTLAKLKGKAAADLNGTFSWRVVGKRSDTKLDRFAKYTMPNIKLAEPPKPPAPPKPRPPQK